MKQKLIKHFDETNVLWRINKIVIYVVIVLIIVILTLLTVIHVLFPLKEIKPYFVTICNKSNQLIKIEPIEINKKSLHLIKESLARRYVILREKIDLQTEISRYHEVKLLSHEIIYKEFESLMKVDNKDSPLREFNDKGIIRSINIMHSENLGPIAPNIWQIEWQARDLNKKTNKIINENVFISTMTIEMQKIKVKHEDQFVNPLGFTVIDYKVAVKREKDSGK